MNQRRRIWHLCSNRWNSAITEYALNAARALNHRGDSIFTPLAGSAAEVRARPFLDIRAVPGFSLLQLPTLIRMARAVKPTAIFTYGGPETVLAAALRPLTGARIIRFRGQELEPASPLADARQKLAHGFVDLVITPSNAIAKAMRDRAFHKNIVPVILGCDEGRFQRQSGGLAPGPEVVVVGRLDPVKGHAKLFEIFAALLRGWVRDAVRPRLVVIGEAANLTQKSLETEAQRAGLIIGVDVEFIAQRIENLSGRMSAAAVGIIPSIGSEVICRVAEEFLLCGTPVAVSGVGSLEEVLFDGAGANYKGRTTAEAAEVLAQLIRVSVTEGEPAKAARAATARTRFSLDAMGNALEQALATVAPTRF